jgi:hypothetical protein
LAIGYAIDPEQSISITSARSGELPRRACSSPQAAVTVMIASTSVPFLGW